MITEGMSPHLSKFGYGRIRYRLMAGFFADVNGRLLDVGCCQGDLRNFLHAGLGYVGVDGISNRFPGFIKTDLNERRLPFRTGSIDAACCCATLEHLFYPLEILKEIERVLKPGGRVLVSLPNDEGLNGRLSALGGVKSYNDSVYGHHWRFSLSTAREFFSKVFVLESEKAEYGPLFRRYLFFLKFKWFCTELFLVGRKNR